jgi:hypothetical protein
MTKTSDGSLQRALTPLRNRFRMPVMKQCPECGAQYEDGVSFCPKHGRVLVAKTTVSTQLCPHCANSIAADATQCPYCKADLAPARAPQWPTRDDTLEAASPRAGSRISWISLAVLVLGLIFFGVGAFLSFAPGQRADSSAALTDTGKEVQEREQKIQSLETELTRVRQELTERSDQVTQLETKLDETQKDLSTVQQRLAIANREVERVASSRAPQSSPALPPPPANTSPPPPPPAPARRASPAGIYETVRATSVYEEPSGSSRVLSKIARGTRVEVVRSTGEWLEVRSKHGKPPGFVRADDAMYINQTN